MPYVELLALVMVSANKISPEGSPTLMRWVLLEEGHRNCALLLHHQNLTPAKAMPVFALLALRRCSGAV